MRRALFPLLLSTLLLAQPAAAASARPAVPGTPATPKAAPPAAAAKAAPRAAGPADVLPFPAQERTLANGLKVIAVPTGFPDIVSVQITVQTGSRNEVEAGKTGFAHFFEHMMFRGTKAYPPERYQNVITRVGARQNAYTSLDLTNYHTTFSKADLEEVLAMEADRFMHLDYPVAAFKTESRAVLGEYNKNSANPLSKLFEARAAAAYRVHTYRHTTMGFLADIEDMPNQYEYSRVFFDRWYRPEYVTVTVAGDVDPARVFAMVEKHWGSWKRGTHRVEIPREPEPQGPIYTHVPWSTATLPLVSVSFHGPAFSETDKSHAALAALLAIYFGESSELYRKLVVDEQKVDQLFSNAAALRDPGLPGVLARVKKAEDALYVRDQLLATLARAQAEPPPERRLADERSAARYQLSRQLDNTEAIAGTVARYAHFRRSFDTANRYYRQWDALTPADVQEAARRWARDERLVVATLSKEALPEGIAKIPALATLAPAAPASDVRLLVQRTKLPQLTVKFVFGAGSARDPQGKEGLAALAAGMIADAGSKAMAYEEIQRALHPLAAELEEQVDKEMATLTLRVHRDNWRRALDVAMPQIVDPGLREDDFRRVKDRRRNELLQDLRSNNEEELAKERLQANLFAGTPYGHPVQGSAAGLDSATLDDVRAFLGAWYTRGALTVGVSGDAPEEMLARLRAELARLPAGTPVPAVRPPAHQPRGLEVEIVQKETRATAISFGRPIEVTRGHPDFAALWLARAWLGEHRSSMSHLYRRIREERGMNYGDYAYVEAFPRGMFEFFPEPNLARRAQIFEVWLRPVAPENAHMAIRLGLHELRRLVEQGLTAEEFESTRTYLTKYVSMMTATQPHQIGYAIDSAWYGIPEFTRYLRDALAKLTREEVNAAVKRHLSATDLSFVIVTQDAAGLADLLVADGFSSIKYDAEKPAALLDEDRAIGATKLGIRREAVRITPVAEVFAR